MLIKLSDEVINEQSLIKIIDYVKMCKGQHGLCRERSKEIILSLQGNQDYISIFQELAIKSSQGIDFTNTIEVVLEAPLDGQIAIENLYNQLKKPAILILENEHSDKQFIETALCCLNSKRLLACIDDFWEMRGGGGCGEIPKLIDKSVATSINSTRVSVVNDSDKLAPTSTLNKTQTNIINKCTEHNISGVTLKKREIENYIPDNVIDAYSEITAPVKKAYVSLTRQQKNHYDLKYGFKNKAADSSDYAGLFTHLSKQSLEALQNGLNKDIADFAFSKKSRSLYTEKVLNENCKHIMYEFKKIEQNITKIL